MDHFVVEPPDFAWSHINLLLFRSKNDPRLGLQRHLKSLVVDGGRNLVGIRLFGWRYPVAVRRNAHVWGYSGNEDPTEALAANACHQPEHDGRCGWQQIERRHVDSLKLSTDFFCEIIAQFEIVIAKKDVVQCSMG